MVAALDNVASFSLAIANILLNEYGFLATASALLLAPEITALGVGATRFGLPLGNRGVPGVG